MTTTVSIYVACAAALAFLIRFFIALCTERNQSTTHVVHILRRCDERDDEIETSSSRCGNNIPFVTDALISPDDEEEHVMSIQEVSAEQLARLFHHYHEALAPDFAAVGEPNPESWRDLSANERNRMIAAARLALLELSSAETRESNDRDRYFAKPGEAQWGC